MPYQYAIDAAKLLEQCIHELQEVIDEAESSRRSHLTLYDMKEALISSERLLYDHFQKLLEQEHLTSSPKRVQEVFGQQETASCLSSSADRLQGILNERRASDLQNLQKNGRRKTKDDPHCYYPRRNATDTLLFRLIVALQLCLVRIDDARYVLTGRRRDDPARSSTHRALHLSIVIAGGLGITSLATCFLRRNDRSRRECIPLLTQSAKVGLAAVTLHWASQTWSSLWMSTKLVKSTTAVEEWNQQWHLVQCTTMKHQGVASTPSRTAQEASLENAKTRRLVEYALHDTPKTSFWHSQGELRFLMLKRAMDVFYASVGTAMEVTKGSSEWQLNLVAAAAASFYSLTGLGASRRAAEATSSSRSARDLLEHAWGMVSLPALKNLSLQASSLLKGAAVADRIEICGIPCFILSREPAPELAAAIKRFHFKHRRRSTPIHTLSTIHEQEEHTPDSLRSSKPFARSCARYRQRDVIFHLTGGGFFAHIIASDLPFLLDWSASTGAAVICPEYALLPEHTFPDALHQVEAVYRALLSGEAGSALGFEVNRIVVTGESAGGNLAASLCVKMCLEADGLPTSLSIGNSDSLLSVDEVELDEDDNNDGNEIQSEMEASSLPRLPDALMLSCPVLNLSLEMSHSRVVGTEDPVLPSGLISAISDAYLPMELGISKKDPLPSPYYATDAVLSRFPPTLLFASSKDPLLDDSVVFNQRLRSLGVESDLRAAQNLPHAYLGLGTAGFPEAQQVQHEIQEWLAFQLTRDREEPCGED